MLFENKFVSCFKISRTDFFKIVSWRRKAAPILLTPQVFHLRFKKAIWSFHNFVIFSCFPFICKSNSQLIGLRIQNISFFILLIAQWKLFSQYHLILQKLGLRNILQLLRCNTFLKNDIRKIIKNKSVQHSGTHWKEKTKYEKPLHPDNAGQKYVLWSLEWRMIESLWHVFPEFELSEEVWRLAHPGHSCQTAEIGPLKVCTAKSFASLYFLAVSPVCYLFRLTLNELHLLWLYLFHCLLIGFNCSWHFKRNFVL